MPSKTPALALASSRVAIAASFFLYPITARAQDATVVLPEVVVNTGGDQAYVTKQSTTALKVPAPIQDVPLSVQVVPHQLIEDRQALTPRQAIETVSGVESSNAVPGSLAFRIRGFTDGGSNLRDGFRETSNQQDVEGIERIEVLKGPASVLYGGSLSSGGVVNVVTKAPVDTNFANMSVIGGSYAFARTTIDVNRDLLGDGSLVLRVDGALDRSDTFRNFSFNNDAFINPSLRWRPTSQDEIVLRTQVLRSDFSYGPYQSPIAQKTLSLPLSFSFTDPNQSLSHRDAERGSYDWVHTFDNGLRFRSGFATSFVNYDLGTDRFASLKVAANGVTVTRLAQSGPQGIRDNDLQNELSGRIDTGPFHHDLLAGVETYWSLNNSTGYQATLPNLNLANSVYGVTIGSSKLTSMTTTRFTDVAGYVQDFITFAPYWHLLMGGRYDTTQSSSLNRLTDVNSPNLADKFSPRAGVTFEPVPTSAIYFNWANGFVPTTAVTATGVALAPSSSQQFEVGLKQQAFDKRVQATVAVYQLTRSNVPTPDPTNALFSVASGQQQSRGVEFDVAGEILPGWKGVGSYAYTFADVTKDNRFTVGSILAGVPRHAGNIWTTYDFAEGSGLGGFGLGTGVRFETSQQATLPNTFSLPGYTRLDAALWYRFKADGRPFKLQLNVQNITNRKIFDTDGANTLRPQAPLTVLASVSASF